MTCEFIEPVLIIHRNEENVAREPPLISKIQEAKQPHRFETVLWLASKAGESVGDAVFGSIRSNDPLYEKYSLSKGKTCGRRERGSQPQEADWQVLQRP
jgi:hypothetical protein